MSDNFLNDLFYRIRTAKNLLNLTREERVLLEAWLNDRPEPPVSYDCDYDVRRRIGSMGEYTDPTERDWWTLLRATLKFNQSEITPAPANTQPQPAPCATPASEGTPGGMTWQEAAERMERLRGQGEPFTSQHKLAELFGCSSGTINKAIHSFPQLTAWAKRTTTAPRAQSITPVVTDRTAQAREMNPEDDAAIREYLEREDLTSDERAFFNSLSTEDQLDFLDDPDKHQKVLGRKP